MDLEEYPVLLGRVLSNLHSLEFLLRAFLYAKAAPPHTPFPKGISLDTAKAGDNMPVNAMTDYDSLSHLIARYNAIVSPSRSDLAIDPTVVDLRDALAHGRVSAPNPGDSLLLVKLARPHAGAATVTYSQPLTSAWLKQQTTRIHDEMMKIAHAPGSPVAQGL